MSGRYVKVAGATSIKPRRSQNRTISTLTPAADESCPIVDGLIAAG
jgi:hypothetical protein